MKLYASISNYSHDFSKKKNIVNNVKKKLSVTKKTFGWNFCAKYLECLIFISHVVALKFMDK